MWKGCWVTGALALMCLPISKAELDPEIAEALRKELDALRDDYEARIDKLEARIAELENQPQPAPAPAPPPPPPVARIIPNEPEEREALANDLRETRDSLGFDQNTETRSYRPAPPGDRALNARIEEVLEGYLDINGYFRAGYGRSDAGGPQRAFGLPGVSKYRLGNETENYGELLFSKTFFTPGSFSLSNPADGIAGPVAEMNVRMSFFNPYDNYGSGADTEFALPEVWASIGNVLPDRPETKFWAGSRFYRRHDIHINDFYFWDMSGGGAGIEDFACGPGKFAFAWIGDGAESAIYDRIGMPDPLNVAGFSKTNFDLRYYDWPFFGGTGEVGLVYSRARSGVDANGLKAEDADGFALTLVRTNEGFLDENSVHKTSLAVGTGPAKTFTSGFDTFSDPTGTYIRPDPNESWRLRFTDHWVVKPWRCVSLGSALVYQYTDFGDNLPEQHWASVGFRPIWHINEWASLAFEGGYDWISNSPNGNPGSLAKFTIAPQVSLGNEFYSRPALRAFLTYAFWNDGQRGVIGGPDYAFDTAGWSWGVQMESWW